jgi:hypothetical protein
MITRRDPYSAAFRPKEKKEKPETGEVSPIPGGAPLAIKRHSARPFRDAAGRARERFETEPEHGSAPPRANEARGCPSSASRGAGGRTGEGGLSSPHVRATLDNATQSLGVAAYSDEALERACRRLIDGKAFEVMMLADRTYICIAIYRKMQTRGKRAFERIR